MRATRVALLGAFAVVLLTVVVLHEASAGNLLANPAGFVVTNTGGSAMFLSNTTPNSPAPTGARVNWANANPSYCPVVDNGTGSTDYCEIDDNTPSGFNGQSCPTTFGQTRSSFSVPTITIGVAGSANVTSYSAALGYHFPNNVGNTGVCVGIWGLQTTTATYVAMATVYATGPRDTGVTISSGSLGAGWDVNQIVLTPALNSGGGGFAYWQMHEFSVAGISDPDTNSSQTVSINGSVSNLGNTTTQPSDEVNATTCGGCQGLGNWNGVPLILVGSTVDAGGVLDVKADPGNATLYKIQLPNCTAANCALPSVFGVTADAENDSRSSPRITEPFKSGASAGVSPCQTFTKACRTFSTSFAVNFSSSPPKTLVGFYCEDPTHFPCYATSDTPTDALFNVTNASLILGNVTVTGNNSNAACVNHSCQVAILLLVRLDPGIAAPTGLTGLVNGYFFDLNWTAPTGLVSGYRLVSVNQFGAVNVIVLGNTLHYEDAGSTFNKTYNVSAFNILGTSPASNNVTLVIPGQPLFGPGGSIYGASGLSGLALALGIPTAAVNVLFGLIFVLIFASLGFQLVGMIGAAAGVVTGLMFSIAAAFFPTWVTVLLLAFGVVALLLFRGSGAGGRA